MNSSKAYSIFQKSIDGLFSVILEHKKTIAMSVQNSKLLEFQLRDAKVVIDRLTKTSGSTSQVHDVEMETLSTKLDECKETVGKLNTTLVGTQQQLADITKESESQIEQIRSLGKDIAKKTTNEAKLDKELKRIFEDFEECKKENMELSDRNYVLRSKVDGIADERGTKLLGRKSTGGKRSGVAEFDIPQFLFNECANSYNRFQDASSLLTMLA
jgi:chromosome segregation ATPase